MVLTGVDQLWRADITYVRLREEFVFLAVILDAFSRRVIGWALDRNMEDELTLTALRMALSRRSIQPGLVHHSDRGSQYASNDYTDLLKAHECSAPHRHLKVLSLALALCSCQAAGFLGAKDENRDKHGKANG